MKWYNKLIIVSVVWALLLTIVITTLLPSAVHWPIALVGGFVVGVNFEIIYDTCERKVKQWIS